MLNTHDTVDLDLKRVERGRRAAAWMEWHESLFFGRAIPSDIPDDDLAGYFQGARLASGSLFKAEAAFRRLKIYSGSSSADAKSVYSVLMQLKGETTVILNDRTLRLRPYDIAFLYGEEVEYETPKGTEILLLNVPASLLLARQPSAVAWSGRCLEANEPVASLLRNSLEGAFSARALLTPSQQNSVLFSLVELLGVARFDTNSDAKGRDERRVNQALKQIELGLFDAAFDANQVADTIHISRRRLDEIFVRILGKPVAPCIWERRLQRACEALRDDSQKGRSVTDIALTHGFEDVAHFARVFKRRFGVTALQWRAAEDLIPLFADMDQRESAHG